MRTLAIFSLVAVALMLGMASSAIAAQPGEYGSITLNGYTRDAGHYMGDGGRFTWNISSSSLNLPPGMFLETVNNGTQLYTFCVQFTNISALDTFDIDNTSYLENPAGPYNDPSPVAALVENLGDQYWQTAVNGNATDAGAFQLVLWELIVGDQNPGNGWAVSGSYTAAAYAQALTWYNSLTTTDLTPNLQMVVLSDHGQNQITQIAVPEATTLVVWSFICGAVGLTVYRRRDILG